MLPTVIPTRDIESTTLDNGVRVVSEYMSHVRSVATGLWIATGARRETPAETGVCHFIEHMLFKGTANRTAEQIAREIDSSGGNLDAYTAKELVSYNTKVLDETLPQAFDVLADMVLHPLFRDEDIEKEKGVILEELKMEVDNPEYLVHELFNAGFWHGDPLGRSILGTKETIKSFHSQFLRDYYNRFYVASNLIVTAAGNIRHRQAVELAQKHFGKLPAVPALSAPSVPEPQAKLTFKEKKSLEQLHVVMGVPSYPIAHPLRYASYVLSTLLGGGMSSRLFQTIREKLGLAYSVFSELNMYRDCGLLAIYAGTSVETAKQVVGLVVQEFRTLKHELVPAEELRRAKDHLKGSIALSLESTSSRMANLARQSLYYDRFISLDEMVQAIEEVTPDQVQQIAQECFHPEKIALTMLGRLEGLRIGREELAC